MHIIQNTKPKRTFIAYCVLAEKLNTPGVGVMQALIPFLAEACQHFSGEVFDAEKFSFAVSERYDIKIPRLAALGLAEQLEREGLLIIISEHKNSIVYKYADLKETLDSKTLAVTETEVETVFASFVDYCKTDVLLSKFDEDFLHSAFLDRLLNADSMRILSRREASISAKKSAETLVLKKQPSEEQDSTELHLDYLVSQFLIDLRDTNITKFEQVSNVAFANMAAEAIACFREPPEEGQALDTLTVYLDSPLLLDMLGVNVEYADYGNELLLAIKSSGAIPAVFDHCIAEAEAAIHAQLSYLRSGINQLSASVGTSVKPDLLSSLSGNVAERAEKRLGISVRSDPEAQLHRRSQATVGDIESLMTNRMIRWRNSDAKEYDRKSVWAMLSISDSIQPSTRICDSKWLLLTRNTPLVSIANDMWKVWLKGSTKNSVALIERSTPIAMSDKQFSGYLWARTGGGNGAMSRARLLAHCSAAVRPRADVKARAYNLVLELNGKDEAEDIAALLEDREGIKALMRATKGDPEDVTQERLPFIIEKVKLAAGEFAAGKVRTEKDLEIEQKRIEYKNKLEQANQEKEDTRELLESKVAEKDKILLQENQDKLNLDAQNKVLKKQLAERDDANLLRQKNVVIKAHSQAVTRYHTCRWAITVIFSILTFVASQISSNHPIASAILATLLGFIGFWFVPDLIGVWLNKIAYRKYKSVIATLEPGGEISATIPDFSKK